MMKLFGRISGAVLAAILMLSRVTPVMAAEEYTYTIRIFAGAQGTVNGQEMMTITGLHYGDRFAFNQSSVSLNDGSKYYIKGIRESGKDNNTITQSPSFVVTGDMDYVIGYGILGDAVAYTVNYVDTEGKNLAPSETYYGNVGDRPVVAYLYIDGYTPQAYNLTGTLMADASQNQFTFVYTSAGTLSGGYTYTPGNTVVRTNIIYEEGGVIVVGGENGAGAVNGANTANTTNGGNNTGADAENTTINDNETPTSSEPAEIVDIRDEQTPLADRADMDNNAALAVSDFSSGISTPVKIAIVSAAVLIIAAAILLLFRKKKEKEDGV